MTYLRKYLIKLRVLFKTDLKATLIKSGLLVLLFGIITFSVDYFLPFGGLSTILRSVLLVPTAFLIFTFLYLIGLHFHYSNMENNPEWSPYRSRFSPIWRRRIAVIAGAFLVVIAQGVNQQVGYTFTSSILGAMIIVILAFIRTTTEEANREELGIPDARDIEYDRKRRLAERERIKKKAEKKYSSKKKKDKKD